MNALVNKFCCPKCGKTKWRISHSGNKLCCDTHKCGYVTAEVNKEFMTEAVKYSKSLDACMSELWEQAEWIDAYGVRDDHYISIETVKLILKDYLDKFEDK